MVLQCQNVQSELPNGLHQSWHSGQISSLSFHGRTGWWNIVVGDIPLPHSTANGIDKAHQTNTHRNLALPHFGWWPVVDCWLLLIFVVTVAVFVIAVGCCCCCHCCCFCCQCCYLCHCCHSFVIAVTVLAIAVAVFLSLSLLVSCHCCCCRYLFIDVAVFAVAVALYCCCHIFCRCRCLFIAVAGFFLSLSVFVNTFKCFQLYLSLLIL